MKIKVIGYIFTVVFTIIGSAIFLYSDFVEPLRYKYPLALGAFLVALVLGWLLSGNEKKAASKNIFIYEIILIVVWIILSFLGPL